MQMQHKVELHGRCGKTCPCFQRCVHATQRASFIEHGMYCKDPTCMFVYCCDGNEKVGRPICGENLPLPSEDTGYIGTDTDVQNAVMRAAHREKICPNFPTRGGQRSCKQCQERIEREGRIPDVQEGHKSACAAPKHTRATHAMNIMHEVARMHEVAHDANDTQKPVGSVRTGDVDGTDGIETVCFNTSVGRSLLRLDIL